VSKRIEASKEAVKKAEAMKIGFLNWGLKEKTDAIVNALVAQNEAISEMSTATQESIKFTCTSIAYSRFILEGLARLMKEGFETRDGNVIELAELNEEANKAIADIVDVTKDNLKRQEAYEKEQAKIIKEIEKLKKRKRNKTVIITLVIGIVALVAAITLGLITLGIIPVGK